MSIFMLFVVVVEGMVVGMLLIELLGFYRLIFKGCICRIELPTSKLLLLFIVNKF